MAVVLGVPREVTATEKRVATVPEVVKKFRKLGVEVLVEQGAGDGAMIPDEAFSDAQVVDRDTLFQRADIVACVGPPDADLIGQVREGATLVGFMTAHRDLERLRPISKRKITVFAMELVPRISRAQSMDALSSQASIAGYKAVLIAAQTSGRFFPMLTTAAGTIRPSKVLVIGAGVAGLQALATARRLGAQTQGYDVRPETKEQVESLGAKFIDLDVSAAGEGGYARELSADEKDRQQEMLAEHLAGVNVVITTAAVPGREAPQIISRAMVERMKPGSVIVDIAAESGGNCELTEAGNTVDHAGVQIVGPVNLASQTPMDASAMYARNVYNFLAPMISDGGEYGPDWEDEVISGTALARDGEIVHEPTRSALEGAA